MAKFPPLLAPPRDRYDRGIRTRLRMRIPRSYRSRGGARSGGNLAIRASPDNLAQDGLCAHGRWTYTLSRRNLYAATVSGDDGGADDDCALRIGPIHGRLQSA